MFIITVVLVLLSLLWAILCGPLLPLVILARYYCIDEPTVIGDEHLVPSTPAASQTIFKSLLKLDWAGLSCLAGLSPSRSEHLAISFLSNDLIAHPLKSYNTHLLLNISKNCLSAVMRMVALVVEASNQMVTSFLKLCWMDVIAAHLELPNMEVVFTMDFILYTLLASSVSIPLSTVAQWFENFVTSFTESQ